MPWQSLQNVPNNLKTIDKIPLSLKQVNDLAKVAEGIGVNEGQNGWAIAKSNFKKTHKKQGGRWVKAEGGIVRGFEVYVSDIDRSVMMDGELGQFAFWKQLIYAGVFASPQNPEEKISITKERIDLWNENAGKGVRGNIPLVLSPHPSNSTELAERSIGFVEKTRVGLDTLKRYSLFGLCNFTNDEFGSKVAEGSIRGVSVGVPENYTDFKTGEDVGEVLHHVSVTNEEHIKDLEPFQALLENGDKISYNIYRAEKEVEQSGATVPNTEQEVMKMAEPKKKEVLKDEVVEEDGTDATKKIETESTETEVEDKAEDKITAILENITERLGALEAENKVKKDAAIEAEAEKEKKEAEDKLEEAKAELEKAKEGDEKESELEKTVKVQALEIEALKTAEATRNVERMDEKLGRLVAETKIEPHERDSMRPVLMEGIGTPTNDTIFKTWDERTPRVIKKESDLVDAEKPDADVPKFTYTQFEQLKKDDQKKWTALMESGNFQMI